MKQLIIIGARGLGREIFYLAQECLGYKKKFSIKGFLDDKKNALDGLGEYAPILNSVENYALQRDDIFICALGDVHWKKHYTRIILEKGGSFHTLIHKSTYSGIHSQIHPGCIISRNVVMTANCCIGEHTYVGPFSNIGHDASVGMFCHLGAYCFLGGYAKIGDNVTLHPRTNILPNVDVGDSAVVGAGSVVLKKIKACDTVFGVPARSVKID